MSTGLSLPSDAYSIRQRVREIFAGALVDGPRPEQELWNAYQSILGDNSVNPGAIAELQRLISAGLIVVKPDKRLAATTKLSEQPAYETNITTNDRIPTPDLSFHPIARGGAVDSNKPMTNDDSGDDFMEIDSAAFKAGRSEGKRRPSEGLTTMAPAPASKRRRMETKVISTQDIIAFINTGATHGQLLDSRLARVLGLRPTADSAALPTPEETVSDSLTAGDVASGWYRQNLTHAYMKALSNALTGGKSLSAMTLPPGDLSKISKTKELAKSIKPSSSTNSFALMTSDVGGDGRSWFCLEMRPRAMSKQAVCIVWGSCSANLRVELEQEIDFFLGKVYPGLDSPWAFRHSPPTESLNRYDSGVYALLCFSSRVVGGSPSLTFCAWRAREELPLLLSPATTISASPGRTLGSTSLESQIQQFVRRYFRTYSSEYNAGDYERSVVAEVAGSQIPIYLKDIASLLPGHILSQSFLSRLCFLVQHALRAESLYLDGVGFTALCHGAEAEELSGSLKGKPLRSGFSTILFDSAEMSSLSIADGVVVQFDRLHIPHVKPTCIVYLPPNRPHYRDRSRAKCGSLLSSGLEAVMSSWNPGFKSSEIVLESVFLDKEENGEMHLLQTFMTKICFYSGDSETSWPVNSTELARLTLEMLDRLLSGEGH